MPTEIPASGEHTFTIQAQNIAELNRLWTTQTTAANLLLTIDTRRVAFWQVRVLDILPLAPVQGVDIIAVRLVYAGCMAGPVPMSIAAVESRLASALSPKPGGVPMWAPGGLLSPSPQSQALFQQQAADMQQAQSIFQQVQAASVNRDAERQAIMQQTQTKIFEITQDVTVNKANAATKAFNAMDGYIRG